MEPLVAVFLNIIMFFYQIFGQNMGIAIISLTIFINLILFPLTKTSLEAAQKQREIQPEIKALKKKYKDNKEQLMKAQQQLMKEKGINPVAGCLPSLFQLGLFIVMFQTIRQILSNDADIVNRINNAMYFDFLKVTGDTVNTHFLMYDLTQKDIINLPFSLGIEGSFFYLSWIPGLLVITAAVIQFLSAKKMLPEVKKAEKDAKETEDSMDDFAVTTQKQMVYLMPVIFLFFGSHYASGLALYFLVSSIFALLRSQLTTGKLIYAKNKS